MNQNKETLYQYTSPAVIFQKIYFWIKHSLDINYPGRPISDYSYIANTKNVKEICRIISAFGTGITDFQKVDVPVEKILGDLPMEIKKDIISDIEEKVVDIAQQKKIKGEIENLIGIMRSNRDFFILSVNNSGSVICETIKFAHSDPSILFDLIEESDGTIRILDLEEGHNNA